MLEHDCETAVFDRLQRAVKGGSTLRLGYIERTKAYAAMLTDPNRPIAAEPSGIIARAEKPSLTDAIRGVVPLLQENPIIEADLPYQTRDSLDTLAQCLQRGFMNVVATDEGDFIATFTPPLWIDPAVKNTIPTLSIKTHRASSLIGAVSGLL